jgi:hypothetical protein
VLFAMALAIDTRADTLISYHFLPPSPLFAFLSLLLFFLALLLLAFVLVIEATSSTSLVFRRRRWTVLANQPATYFMSCLYRM